MTIHKRPEPSARLARASGIETRRDRQGRAPKSRVKPAHSLQLSPRRRLNQTRPAAADVITP